MFVKSILGVAKLLRAASSDKSVLGSISVLTVKLLIFIEN